MIPHKENHYKQPAEILMCPKHHEQLQGICIYSGKCDSRLLCRKCRKSHANIHPPQLNYYEEIQDLLSGRIVQELCSEMNQIISRIDEQNREFERSNKILIDQINQVYQKATENILKKMDDTRAKLVEEVTKTAKSNEKIKDKIIADVSSIGSALSSAILAQYQGNSLEYLVKVICSTLSLKTAIENDPMIFTVNDYSSRVSNLTNVQLENLYQGLNQSLEKIDFDIVGTFVKELKEVTNLTPANSNVFRRIENGQEPLDLSQEEEKHNAYLQQQQQQQQQLLQQQQQRQQQLAQQLQAQQQSYLNQPHHSNNQSPFTYHNPQNQPSSTTNNLSQNIFKSNLNTGGQESQVRMLIDRLQANEAGGSSPLVNVDFEFLRPIKPNTTPTTYTIPNMNERNFAREDDARSDISQHHMHDVNRSTSPHYPPNHLNPNKSFESQRRLFEDTSPSLRTGFQENPSLNRPLNIYDSDMPRYTGKSSPFDAMRIGNHHDSANEHGPYKKRGLTGDLLKVVNNNPALNNLFERPAYNPGYLSNPVPSKTAKRRQKKKERLEKRMRHHPSDSPPRGPLRNEERTTTPQQILNLFKHVDETDKHKSYPRHTEKVIKKVTIETDIKEEEDGEDTVEAIDEGSLTAEQIVRNLQQYKKKNNLFFFDYGYRTSHLEVKSNAMIYIPSYKHIVTGGEEGRVMIFSAENKKKITEFHAHQGPINYVYYLAERDVLVTCSDGVTVWNYDGGFKQLGSFSRHIGRVYSIEYLPNINALVSGGEDEALRIWNVESFKEFTVLKTKGKQIHSLCYIKEHHLLAAGFNTGKINVIRIEPDQKKASYTINAHKSTVCKMKYHERTSILFTCGDSEVKAFKVGQEGSQTVATFKCPGSLIYNFDFSEERNLMIGSCSGHKIYAWKLSSGAIIQATYEAKVGDPILFLKGDKNIGSFSNGEVNIWKLT